MGWCSIVGLPPSIKFAGTHLYTWVERGTVRVKCLAQEHSTMSPARAWTWTAQSRDERTNHEATTPPKQDIKHPNPFIYLATPPPPNSTWQFIQFFLTMSCECSVKHTPLKNYPYLPCNREAINNVNKFICTVSMGYWPSVRSRWLDIG